MLEVSPPRPWAAAPVLSVVVPVFNEQANLTAFHARLSAVMDRLGTWEAVFVDDGSTDASRDVLNALHRADPRVAVLSLSRNFGKEIATTAGLDHARGAAMIIIDADLQDPPELIPDLVAGWREGFDTVYAQRRTRAGESWLKRLTAHLFYRAMDRLADIEVPVDTGDFRLMSRRVVDAVLQLREHHRCMKGLFAWVGFSAKAVLYDRDPRHAGRSTWGYVGLWGLALESITGFTVATQGRNLSRPRGCPVRERFWGATHRPHAPLRQSCSGLSEPHVGDPVSWRRATHHTRRDRRVSGPRVQ